jgi:hypothetical protein
LKRPSKRVWASNLSKSWKCCFMWPIETNKFRSTYLSAPLQSSPSRLSCTADSRSLIRSGNWVRWIRAKRCPSWVTEWIFLYIFLTQGRMTLTFSRCDVCSAVDSMRREP